MADLWENIMTKQSRFLRPHKILMRGQNPVE